MADQAEPAETPCCSKTPREFVDWWFDDLMLQLGVSETPPSSIVPGDSFEIEFPTGALLVVHISEDEEVFDRAFRACAHGDAA